MPPPVLSLGHPAHRNRVAVQLARYFALPLVNVEGTLAWGTDSVAVDRTRRFDCDLGDDRY